MADGRAAGGRAACNGRVGHAGSVRTAVWYSSEIYLWLVVGACDACGGAEFARNPRELESSRVGDDPRLQRAGLASEFAALS
jgi:hypothetical protein